MTKKINEHEGKKHLRLIHSADGKGEAIWVDVYCVLEAFGVTCPARAHAIKKLLSAGQRGKGSAPQDLLGVEAAVSRAIELQKGREEKQEPSPFSSVIGTLENELTLCLGCGGRFPPAQIKEGLCKYCREKIGRFSAPVVEKTESDIRKEYQDPKEYE